jgi:hypothetical protein
MYRTLKRALPRIFFMWALGAMAIGATSLMPTSLGPIGAPLLFGFGLCLAALATGDLAMRILQPKVDAQFAAERAMREQNVGAGLVYLGRCILTAVVLILMVTSARAETPPGAAIPLLPILSQQQREFWPAMPHPAALGAQVEQETCPSLKSRQCWSPKAELRTSREQGIGLGQLTRAWRADGTLRFDSLTEMVRSFPEPLAGLSWENRYDPTLQLRALVLKDKQTFDLVEEAATQKDRLAMTFAAYNGGFAGLNADRRSCAATPGCDSGKWFGHVEHTSLKAKTAVPGYGKSFFEINREYVRNVMVTRTVRYQCLGVV